MSVERRCSLHRDCALVGDVTLRCPRGHGVRKWIVVDASRREVGWGDSDGFGALTAGTQEPRFAVASGPAGPCRNGHTGRWRPRSDNRGWRCAACHYKGTRDSRIAKQARASLAVAKAREAAA